ncbi:hypothetical protein ACP70R_027254 [Stipagrostis hirtigluma subsp. patula]
MTATQQCRRVTAPDEEDHHRRPLFVSPATTDEEFPRAMEERLQAPSRSRFGVEIATELRLGGFYQDLLAGMTKDELLQGVEGLLATVRNLMASQNAQSNVEHSMEFPDEKEERFQEE